MLSPEWVGSDFETSKSKLTFPRAPKLVPALDKLSLLRSQLAVNPIIISP